MLRIVVLVAILAAVPEVAQAQWRLFPFSRWGKSNAGSQAPAEASADSPQAKQAATPDDGEYQQLAERAKAADEAFQVQMGQAKDDQARAALNKRRPDFTRQFEDLAQRRQGTPVGLKALVWLCRFGPKTNVERYIDEIIRDYLGMEQVVDAMRATAPYAGQEPATRKLYQAAMTRSPHRDVRGLACYYMAYSCVPEPDFGAIPAAREPEAVALLERVIKQYGDVPSYRGPLGALAEGGLNAIKHLKVGKLAPEIQGRDVAGRPMKLSNFRGQVVVVTFWADWCGPCRAEMPLHHKLVEKYSGRPFVLLGVNGDQPKELKSILAREKIKWPNWSDGPAGPISAAWSVGMWPTTYVIDHRGMIRYRAVTADRLDAMVGGLLREMGPAGEERSASR